MREIRAFVHTYSSSSPVLLHQHQRPRSSQLTTTPRHPLFFSTSSIWLHTRTSPSLSAAAKTEGAAAAGGFGYFADPHSLDPVISEVSPSTPPPSATTAGLPQRMILTDAMALLYRSHFAFGQDHRLRNSAGEDTTILFGFLSTLLSLLELQPSPTHLVVVFDASGKTFRHELYPGYKGQRPVTPDEIRSAVPRLIQILQAMGVAEMQVPGVEADDAIGTVAVRSVQAGMAVAIASPDKDFFQLLRPGLILLRPPKKADALAAVAAGASKAVKFALQPYTSENFREEWQGLEPSQFVDVLALMGDASDNVPGVEGIGPKTAMSLLTKYSSLDEILAQAHDITPKRKATAQLATAEGAAAALLSRQLVQIQTNLDLPPVVAPLETFRVALPGDGGQEALRLLKELEFEVHSNRMKRLWERMEREKDNSVNSGSGGGGYSQRR